MYVQGKNTELFTVKMNQGRSKALLTTGAMMFAIGVIILLAGSMMWENVGRSDRQTFMIGIGIVSFICLEMGGGSLMNASVIKAVKLTIYDEGICGTAAEINGFCGLFSKANAFDMKFSEITTVRLEGGGLLIQQNGKDYRFQFGDENNQVCYRLIMEQCG